MEFFLNIAIGETPTLVSLRVFSTPPPQRGRLLLSYLFLRMFTTSARKVIAQHRCLNVGTHEGPGLLPETIPCNYSPEEFTRRDLVAGTGSTNMYSSHEAF